MVFRKAKEEDLTAIAQIYEEIHSEEEKGNMTICWKRGIYPTIQTAKAALLRGDMFVAELNGNVIGSAVINQLQVDSYKEVTWEFEAEDSEVMVLHTLSISPKMGRKGYGSQFVGFYEAFALKNGCRYLRMDTNEKNTSARSLYKKLGYKEIGAVPCEFNGIHGFRMVMLEKKL